MKTVKNPRTLSALALLLVAAIAGTAALNTAQGQDKKEKAVSDYMEDMNAEWKLLRKAGKDKSYNADSLKQIYKMQELALITMHMEPPMAAKFSGAEKEKFVTDYRKAMAKMVTEMMNIEIALLEKRYDEAAVMLDKGMNAIKKDGHDKFVEE